MRKKNIYQVLRLLGVLFMMVCCMNLTSLGPLPGSAMAASDAGRGVYYFQADPNNIVWASYGQKAYYMEYYLDLPPDITFKRGAYAVMRYSLFGGADWTTCTEVKPLVHISGSTYHVDWSNFSLRLGAMHQLAIYDGNPLKNNGSTLKAAGSFPYIIADVSPMLLASNSGSGNDLAVSFSLPKWFADSNFSNGMYAVLRWSPDVNTAYIPAREPVAVAHLRENKYQVVWGDAAPKPGRCELVLFNGNPKESGEKAVEALGFYDNKDPAQNTTSTVYHFNADPNNIVLNPSHRVASCLEYTFTLPPEVAFQRHAYAMIRYSILGGGAWTDETPPTPLSKISDTQFHVMWNDVPVNNSYSYVLSIFDGDPVQDVTSPLKAVAPVPYILDNVSRTITLNPADGTKTLTVEFNLAREFATHNFPSGMYAGLRWSPDENTAFIPAREPVMVNSLGNNRCQVVWTNATPQAGRLEVLLFDGNFLETGVKSIKAMGFFENKPGSI